MLEDPIAGATTINTAVNITATVTDCNGFPVPAAQVTFTPTAGSVAPTVQFSNAAGKVFTTWTLGGTTGVQKLFAAATGAADPYAAVFGASTVQSVTVTPMPPASISATNPPASPSAAGSAHSIKFQVLDANGAAVAGQLVTFSVTAGGGTVAPGSGTTDSSGFITTTWTLGAAAATVNTLTATAGSVSTTVSASTP